MVCKEDVVSWFNELESYKRIETMCTLLNMCLPFELRFLGTCIEGLGRRDFQLLRGVSHSVNTAKELTAIYDSCLTGGPSDQRIRRKLALYVALLRFGKIDCVNDLFRVLAGWDLHDLLNVPSGVALEEILLLYTLAHWHPVFNFEQRQHCGNIVKRLTEERMTHNNAGQHCQGGLKNLSRPMTQMSTNVQDHVPLILPTVPITNTTQSLINAVPHHTHTISSAVQIGSEVSSLTNMSPVSNSSSVISSLPSPGQISLQTPGIMGVHSTHLTNEALLPGGHLLQPIISLNEFTIPHGPWSRAPVVPQPVGPVPQIEQMVHSFTSSPSPLMSQTESPAHSRASSPSLQIQQQQQQTVHSTNNPASRTNNPRPLPRTQRRPSNEATPPPPQQAPPTQDNALLVQAKDLQTRLPPNANKAQNMKQHLRNYTLHEVSHMDEEKIGIPTGTMNELRTLVNCNGVCITNCTNPTQNHCQINMTRSKHSQQPPAAYAASQLQALRLDADSALHQSSASESGSSGSAGHSPPDTPSLGMGNSTRSKDRCRLNGRPEKPFSRLNDTVGMPVTTQFYIPHGFGTRGFGFQHSYRPPPLPFQPSPNGELMYPFPPHPYLHPVPVYPPASTTPARSCYNCGGTGHSGADCKELTMEEIARPGLYQLDYTSTSASSTPDLATDK